MGSTTQLAIQMDKLYSTKFNTALIVLLVLFYALTIVFFPLGVFAMLAVEDQVGVDLVRSRIE